MRIYFLIIILFFSISSFSAKKHPLHIALVSIEYNAKNKNFDVLFKIFVDDFETIILKKYGINMNTGKSSENPKYGFYCTSYVKEHFGIVFNNGKKYTNELIYKEKDSNIEAVWLKFEMKAPALIENVKIKTTIMTDLFDDQTNLIVFKYKNHEEAFKLDNIVKENSFKIK
jgi:hypothetical protein